MPNQYAILEQFRHLLLHFCKLMRLLQMPRLNAADMRAKIGDALPRPHVLVQNQGAVIVDDDNARQGGLDAVRADADHFAVDGEEAAEGGLGGVEVLLFEIVGGEVLSVGAIQCTLIYVIEPDIVGCFYIRCSCSSCCSSILSIRKNGGRTGGSCCRSHCCFCIRGLFLWLFLGGLLFLHVYMNNKIN